MCNTVDNKIKHLEYKHSREDREEMLKELDIKHSLIIGALDNIPNLKYSTNIKHEQK